MGFVSRILRILFDASVVLCIICLVPGGFPKGEYDVIQRDETLPREGALAPNNVLDAAVRLFDGKFSSPEAVAYRGNKNEIFISMHGGSIVKVYGTNYSKVKEVIKIGPGCRGLWDERVCGRPLGLRFANDGRLLVADSYLGIFKVDVDNGETERLFNPYEPINGAAPLLIDDLDEDAADNIYWSDASTTGDLSEGAMETLLGPSGRLVKLSPSGHNTVLMDKLYFPNGVQLSPNQDFVLVCETLKHRVLRYWLSGPNAGTSDVFVKGLPGFPDNLRSRPEGGYYVNLVSVKDPNKKFELINILSDHPWLRRGLARIFYSTKKVLEGISYVYDNYYTNVAGFYLMNLAPIAEFSSGNRTMVLIVNEEGEIISSLQSETGTVKFISHTEQVDDRLFFGSPYNDYLGMITLDKVNKHLETISTGDEVADVSVEDQTEKSKHMETIFTGDEVADVSVEDLTEKSKQEL